MPTYIKLIDWALKDNEAAVVLSATTYPDATFTVYQ
jgi:cyclopropane-fatty-acyl-phospholipid synthase